MTESAKAFYQIYEYTLNLKGKTFLFVLNMFVAETFNLQVCMYTSFGEITSVLCGFSTHSRKHHSNVDNNFQQNSLKNT